jgi:hypothetical protein
MRGSLMTIQNYSRIYEYIHEYQNLVYDYYSKHVVAFLTTYYNLNVCETIWEDEDIMGGAYEQLGELTGIKRNKILMLPVFYSEEINTSFDAQEIGYVKENETSFVIPSTYDFKPYPNDIIKLEQDYLSPNNDTHPIFIVTGVEIHPNTERRFWKIKCKNFQSETLQSVEDQVINTYSFVEYDKKIHTLVDSQFIAKLLYKHSLLKEDLKNLYDSRCGYYFIPRNPLSC